MVVSRGLHARLRRSQPGDRSPRRDRPRATRVVERPRLRFSTDARLARQEDFRHGQCAAAEDLYAAGRRHQRPGTRCRGLERRGPRRQDRQVPGRTRGRQVARRPSGSGFRDGAGGRQAGSRAAPLRRPADRRHGAARGRHRRDADRRGQDARRDARDLPQRAPGRRRPRRHGQRLPGPPRRRMDGPRLHVPGPERRHHRARARRRASARRPMRPTSPTAPTTNTASITFATT